jgi:poly(hydroxyalkanoate) depolymerase family esterase
MIDMTAMTRRRSFQLATVCVGLLLVGPARAASWRTNVNYGASTPMDLYVPDRPAASPAIVVSLHYCGGNAGAAHSWFQTYADQYGFIIIAPKSAGSCFDAGLGRSGERANIVKMVQYVITQNNADPRKVYAAGLSSGACMTQAMLASYPDVFAGGSSLAGVPAGAWTGGGAYGWSAPASTTAQQWGDKVRNADATFRFTGSRPRIQFWHGMGDTNLTYSQAYPAQVAQWTNVFGVTDANATKENIKPPGARNTWARSSYKDCTGLVVVEANSGPSTVTHDLGSEGLWQDAVRFFGLAEGGTPVDSCGGAGGAGGAAGGGGAGGAGGAGGSTSGAGGASGSGGRGGAGAAGGNRDGGADAGGGGTGASGASGTTGAGGSAGNAADAGIAGTAGTTGVAGAQGTGGGNAGSAGGSSGAAGSGASAGAVGTGGSTTGLAGMGGSGSGGSPMEDDGAGGCACEMGPSSGHPRVSLAALLAAFVGLMLRARKRTRR